MAQQGGKAKLEEILERFEHMAMEDGNKDLQEIIKNMSKKLAESGREDEIFESIKALYSSVKNSEKLKGNVADQFKKEMEDFFQMGQPSKGATGTSKHKTSIDVKVSSLSQYGVDAGQAPGKLQEKDNNTDGSDEVKRLQNELQRLKEECAANLKLKTANEALMKENENLKKEMDRLCKQMDDKNATINKLEVNVNEQYARNVDIQQKLEDKLDKLKRKYFEMEQDFQNCLTERNHLEKSFNDANKYIKKKAAEHEENLNDERRKFADDLKKIKAERDDLRDRFSKLAGAKLTDQNPDIADLSDPNRAMKVSEKFGSLYDDDWTNAFEALLDKRVEKKEAIQTLLKILTDAWDFCKLMNKSQLDSLCHVLLCPYQEVSKSTVDTRQKKSNPAPKIDSKSEAILRKLQRDIGVMPATIKQVQEAFSQ